MAGSPKTVDEYIQSLPAEASKALAALRKAIIAAAPGADEKISYRIPFYKLNGHLAAYMAHKEHCSFVTMSHSVVELLKKELVEYEISGTTIHFPYKKPVPSLLIKKIIKKRLAENELKARKKKSKDKPKNNQ
jgi:uncharacterized protein YdhG (YjbR/CyaY superfamily)